MSGTVQAAQRYVPGAPPPTTPTKSQMKKKKKKASAALKAEEGLRAEVLDTILASQDGTLNDHTPLADSEHLEANQSEEKEANGSVSESKPPTPVVDRVLNKRIRALNKKITRSSALSTIPESELSEKQKEHLATLSIRQEMLKELEEVKKNVEVVEQEVAEKQAIERATEQSDIERRVSEAVSYTEAKNVQQVRILVAFLALSTLLAAPIPVHLGGLDDHRVPTDDTERQAVIEAGRTLLTPEFGSVEKEDLLKGLLGLLAEGSFAGLGYDRLREIAQEFIHLPTPIPSAPPTPVAPPAPLEEPSSETEPVPAPVPAETPELPSSQPVVLTSGSAVIPTTGSFQFMNASELDAETMAAAPAHDPLSDSTAEWVQVSTPTHEPVVSDTVLSEEVQKLVEEETQEIRNEQDAGLPAEAAAATDASTVNWADDDGELPDIHQIEEKFGKSGTATPVATSAPSLPSFVAPEGEARLNGIAEHPHRGPRGEGAYRGGRGGYGARNGPLQPDGDGYGPERRGHAGHGGDRRGGYRGGDRGRGRGNWEGRGGRRGSYGGERGNSFGYGSDRPKGGRGGYRGGHEDDGGRGQGRGRGSYRSQRPESRGAPPAVAAVPQ